MTYGTAKLKGADELARVLRALPDKLGDPAMASALRKGASVVKKEAAETAPKRTGTLRKNILIKKAKDRDRGEVAYEVGPAGPGLLRAVCRIRHVPATGAAVAAAGLGSQQTPGAGYHHEDAEKKHRPGGPEAGRAVSGFGAVQKGAQETAVR